MYNTIEEYAEAMSQLLFEMRIESDFITEDVPEEYLNKIVDDPKHQVLIKKRIYDNVLEDAKRSPDNHKFEGEFGYNTDTYDFAHAVDAYVEELYEAERQARLKKKWKVWVEIERIETDPEDPMSEDYIDEECPIGISYCDSLEEAVELQKGIEQMFGTI